MAGSDYYSCDVCGTRTFYDANVDWEEFAYRIGEIRVTCSNCFDKGIRIKPAKGKKEVGVDPVSNGWVRSLIKEERDKRGL